MSGNDLAPFTGMLVGGIVTHGAGPQCLRETVDWGARAFNIENEANHDGGREVPPVRVAGYSPFFLTNNAGVESLYLDYANKAYKDDPLAFDGMKALIRVIRECDGFVTNTSPKIVQQLGLHYEGLVAAEARLLPDEQPKMPRVVCVRINGNGWQGNDWALGAYATNMEWRTGLASLNPGPDGKPQRCPTPFLDFMASKDAVKALAAGWLRRGRTGLGGQFDISLGGEAVQALNYQLTYALNGFLRIQPRADSEHQTVPTARAVQTLDEVILIMVMTDAHWLKLCKVIERPDLLEDPRFKTQERRQNSRDALAQILRPIFARKPAAEWDEALKAEGLPVDEVRTIYDLSYDEQAWANNWMVRVHGSPLGEDVTIPGFAVQIPGYSSSTAPPAAWLGQNSIEILTQTGFSRAEIDELIDKGLVKLRVEGA